MLKQSRSAIKLKRVPQNMPYESDDKYHNNALVRKILRHWFKVSWSNDLVESQLLSSFHPT